jgi:hypothetical protein
MDNAGFTSWDWSDDNQVGHPSIIARVRANLSQ